METDFGSTNFWAFSSSIVTVAAVVIGTVFMYRHDKKVTRRDEAIEGVLQLRRYLEWNMRQTKRPLRDYSQIIAIYNLVLALEAAYRELGAKGVCEGKVGGFELPQFLPILKEQVKKAVEKEQLPEGIEYEEEAI